MHSNRPRKLPLPQWASSDGGRPRDGCHVRGDVNGAISHGPAIEALVQAVRAIIDRHVPTLTGAQLTHIDITIEDIATPTD